MRQGCNRTQIGPLSSPNSSSRPGRKRKRDGAGISGDASSSGGGYDDESVPPYKAKKPRASKSSDNDAEKRLRKFRPKAPQAFHDVYERALTQRFYVLSRTRWGTATCPEEVVEMTGSTGNIYTVHIARQPTCDCPHAKKGNQCKHVLYALSRVLRAKHQYIYQLALLSTELQDIFAHAPPPVGQAASAGGAGRGEAHTDKNRKPIDGDCPICFNEMETGPGKEAIVYCRAACGQNMHKQCFDMWAKTKRQGGARARVTCPYCRAEWQDDGEEDILRAIKSHGFLNGDGYVNVADQLGISTRRDYSTYSRWWSGHPRHRHFY